MSIRCVCAWLGLQVIKAPTSRTRTLRFSLLVAIALTVPYGLHAEDSSPASDGEYAVTKDKPPEPPPVPSDLTVSGMVSYGNWRIFASGRDCRLYTAAIEYDRHSWGYFLKARMDYVAEVLPFMLLRQPTVTYPWGQPLTTEHELVPGIAINPIGFRMLWRDGKGIKPYFSAKGGMLAFTKKVLYKDASYQEFSFQTAVGLNARLNPRFDLRLGLFSDMHFSNAFMVPINPGLDVMNSSLGLTYHLDKDRH
ncbi:MAG TPA: acyloxyacyl hydrolase [Terracidiphilus sp.]|nr:acyloxyacyl hydrolase [Terracidiphilus sp.]